MRYIKVYPQLTPYAPQYMSHLPAASCLPQERFGLAQQVVDELLRSRLKAQEEDQKMGGRLEKMPGKWWVWGKWRGWLEYHIFSSRSFLWWLTLGHPTPNRHLLLSS